MTSLETFENWAGATCTDERRRIGLYQQAALRLGQLLPCTAGKGFDGSGFSDALDRAYWRHAVGAMAAYLYLLTPEGRRALNVTNRTEATEAGQGTDCDPRRTSETTYSTAKMDADKIAQLAFDDAVTQARFISCVIAESDNAGQSASLFGLSGRRRLLNAGRCR